MLLAGCKDAPLSALHGASQQADHIATVWYAMAWGSALIVAFMVVLACVAVWSRSNGENRRRNIVLMAGGGVAFPVVVISAMLAYTYGAAPVPQPAGYIVEVTGNQWFWQVRYPLAPGGPKQSINEIHVPSGTSVSVKLTSHDVIHSFWVPRLSGKIDAIPGRVNSMTLVASEPGEYLGTCAEYCGVGHAHMQLKVIAHEPHEVEAVLSRLDAEEGQTR